jgi:hypothetical protein
VLAPDRFLKTTDGGNTFSEHYFSGTFQDLHFVSETDGKIVGYENGGVIWSTTDGGNTFTTEVIGQDWSVTDTVNGFTVGNIYRLTTIDYLNNRWEIGGSNYEYNGGEYPYILHYDNGQWVEQIVNLTTPYGDATANILDVGRTPSGKVLHIKAPATDAYILYINGNRCVSAPTGQFYQNMNELAVLSDSIIFIPANGDIVKYNLDDACFQWDTININGIYLSGGVCVYNSTISYYGGKDGKIAKYENTTTSSQSISFDELEIFPNPTQNQLNISMPYSRNGLHLKIYNTLGQVVFSQSDDYTVNTSIDVSHLTSGTYIIHIQNEEMNVSKWFVKE